MADAITEAVDANLIQGEDIEEEYDAAALDQLAEEAEAGVDETEAEDGIRDHAVTGVLTCALPIFCKLWWSRKGVYAGVYKGVYGLVNLNSGKTQKYGFGNDIQKNIDKVKELWVPPDTCYLD